MKKKLLLVRIFENKFQSVYFQQYLCLEILKKLKSECKVKLEAKIENHYIKFSGVI